MRLKKNQKELLLAWISEGLQSDEINERAAAEEPSFVVTRSQVQGYRDRRALDMQAIRRAGEHDALTQGLAIKAERVRKLQQLAVLMERDLFGGFLWTDQIKMIGSGDAQQEVEYEEFNGAEVIQYRGVLDDIAKELGDRRTNSVNTNVSIDWGTVPADIRDAFIDGKISLEDVFRKLHRTN